MPESKPAVSTPTSPQSPGSAPRPPQGPPPPSTKLKGYHYLARFFTQTETGFVRKFKPLATLNILYLQAELCHLENQLAEHRRRDAESGDRQRVDIDWSWLLLSEPALNNGSRQWDIVLEIREKLDQYYAALSRYSQVSSMSRPSDEQRRGIFNLMAAPSMLDTVGLFQSPDLAGVEGPASYGREFAADLVFLDAREEENDAVSRWLTGPVFSLLHFFCKRVKKPLSKDLANGTDVLPVHTYSSSQYNGVNHVVGSLFGAAVPLTSMVILFLIQDMGLKLGLVCVFTIVFCLALSTLSKARRIEVFAATAAFGSVLVVWISNTNQQQDYASGPNSNPSAS